MAGAGFLAAEDIVLTCAHVVSAAGAGPGERLQLVFPHAPGAPQVGGLVLEEAWRAPEDEDVAVVRLSGLPAGIEPLSLGSAAACRGRQVRSFGFPAQAPTGGHFGFGRVGDLLPTFEGSGAHLQLTGANDLTTGFSGGPIADEVTGLVIGMLTEITAPDEHHRGQDIAYATPTRVLREIWPELAEQDVCPYRGLEPFTAEHAQWFQGRKDAVRQVLANLAQQQRMTLLLGPSGSGKSSLVQAGVLPALAAGELPGSDRWLPVLARPGQDLLVELERAGLPGASSDGIAAAVTRKLAADPTRQRVVLIIDQFEELLTSSLTGRQQERRLAATDQITAAVKSHVALSVIMIMRDDFYPQQAALAPKLLKAAMPGLLNVPGTLSQEDLHDIITLPAHDVGARFEHGLPEQMITDILATTPEGTTTRQAPVTVLPLLELTLSQLWKRRHDGYLTHNAYRRIGGVTGSLTTWCDTALNQLPPNRRPTAHRILTSLVRPADPDHHVPATRKQVSLQELRDLAADPHAGPDSDNAFDDVIAVLTRHRIITTRTPLTSGPHNATTGQPVAELIHDALIREWGTLREWVRQDHRFNEWLEHTREQRNRWAEGTDPGDLLGGTTLAEGLEWSEQRRLPGDIADFLTASKQRQQAVIRRSRRLNTVLAALLVLALTAAGGAIWQWRTVTAERQAALSRQLAAQSGTLINHDSDLAALLAIHAYHNSPTPEAVESLENAAALPLQRRLAGHTEAVLSVAFSPDGKTLATGSDDKTARLWDTATGKQIRAPLTAHTGPVLEVAFSPDGKTLATSSDDKTARLWDTATGKQIHAPLTAHTGSVWSVAFSPDGKTLATSSDDKTARLWDTATGMRLWDTATGKQVRAPLTGHTGPVESVAFSPDGKMLATGSVDRSVRLWDAATGKQVRAPLTAHTGPVLTVAFSPDGKILATGNDDNTVRLWDTATGKEVRAPLTGHAETILSVAFSPDGKTLASGSHDKSVRLWDTAAGREVRAPLTGHTGPVESVAFSPDGKTLATSSRDKTVRLWDTATGKQVRPPLTGHTEPVLSVAFSPDGKTRTAVGYGHGQAGPSSPDRPHRTCTFGGVQPRWQDGPDGKTLATGGDDNTARLWDTATGKEVRAPLTGHTETVWSVAFSPDGKTLATGSDDKTARLWDTATGKEVRAPLTGHTETVWSVAFSPDGKTLATGSDDKTARLSSVALLQPAAAIQKICRAVNRDLTARERAAYLPDHSADPVCHTS